MLVMVVNRLTGSILLATAVLFLSIAPPVAAQRARAENAQEQQQMVDRMISRLDMDLSLSDSQESRIRRILVQHTAAMQARRSELAGSARTKRSRVARSELKQEMQRMKVQTQDAIKQVLTPGQRDTFEENIRAWEAERKRRHEAQRSDNSR